MIKFLPQRSSTSRRISFGAISVLSGVLLLGIIWVITVGWQNKSSRNSVNRWALYIPDDSRDASCKITQSSVESPSGEKPIKMWSDQRARYAIKPQVNEIQVHAGERYKLTAYVKLGEDTKVDLHSPGVLLRATLQEKPNVDYDKGHFYVSAKKSFIGYPRNLVADSEDLKHWTKLEGILEVPEKVSVIKFLVFCWYTTGEVFVDDARVERLP